MKNKNKNREQFITLAEAAGYTSYSAAYLKLRVTQGKLRATKIDGKWYTTREWVNEYLSVHGLKGQPNRAPVSEPVFENKEREVGGNLVTLQEAAVITPYSAQFLQLLAKSGKLKAVISNGNWYTKLEWVEDYLVWLSGTLETVGNEKAMAPVTVIEPAPVSEPTPVVAPAPAPAPVMLERAPAETRSWLLEIRNWYRNWKLEIGHFLNQLISSSQARRIAASSLIAVLLFVSLSNDSVRASFADWSKELAKQVSQTAKQFSTKIARNSSVMLERARRMPDEAIASILDSTLDSTSGFYRSVALQATSLQNDISSSLAAISIPDISLPDLNLSPYTANLSHNLSLLTRQASNRLSSASDYLISKLPKFQTSQQPVITQGLVLGESASRLAVSDSPQPTTNFLLLNLFFQRRPQNRPLIP